MHHPHRREAIFDALMAVFPQSPLQLVWADRELMAFSAITSPGPLKDPLQFTIYVQSTGPASSVVTVQVNQRGTYRVRRIDRTSLTPALHLIAYAVAAIVPGATP